MTTSATSATTIFYQYVYDHIHVSYVFGEYKYDISYYLSYFNLHVSYVFVDSQISITTALILIGRVGGAPTW